MSYVDGIRRRIWSRYRDEILREAEALCRGHNTLTPNTAPAMHLRGLLASVNGEHRIALAYLRRAASSEPTDTAYLVDLGDALSRSGHLDEALATYLRALGVAPEDPSAYRGIGHALLRRGSLREAVAAYSEAARLDPTSSDIHRELGDALRAQGRTADASRRYETALRLEPDDSECYLRLGEMHLSQQEWSLAVDSFRRGVQRKPDRADLYVGMGEALLRSGLIEDAVAALRAAVNIEPVNLGACRLLVCALELTARAPDVVGAWYCLGVASERRELFEEAADAYKRAIARKSDCLRALIGLGSACLELAQPQTAIESLRAALAVDSGQVRAHHLLVRALGLFGNHEEAFEERAWLDEHHALQRFEQPLWDGSPMGGKTILLWTSGGLDDTVQLVRFATTLKEMGARVIVECDRSLEPLMWFADGVDDVVAQRTALPKFDVHVPLTSLPWMLHPIAKPLACHVPYLRPTPAPTQSGREQLAGGGQRTIGLVWGNAQRSPDARSCDIGLEEFAVLAGLPELCFVSLQTGQPALELLTSHVGLQWVNAFEVSRTSAELATLIQGLDLVIAVDSLVAHIAGALGVPVWTLLPFAPDGRWGLHGDSSPWYPTMRLFRQPRRGDWLSVLKSVRSALKDAAPAHQ